MKSNDIQSGRASTGIAAGLGAASVLTAAPRVHAAGSDTIRVGILGCGGRNRGASRHCLAADPGVEIVAMADLFHDKCTALREGLLKEDKYKDRVKVSDDMIFTGFDCHEKIAKTDVDLILIATAPAFRPWQMMAAAKAGKHTFVEKPVAVDVAGCRMFMEAAKISEEKGLSLVAGTQRRHEFSRLELMKRIHEGEIGDLVGGQCYWYGGGIWYRGVKEGMTELEWQCENWYHFTWLSGDQICEQHIHNIDVMNWCFNGPPKKFTAVGGRQWRNHEEQAREVAKFFNNGSDADWKKYDGNIWDHIFAEFEYENGARCLSFSGHSPGTGRSNEKIVGTKAVSDCNSRIMGHKGEKIWEFDGPMVNGQEQEHIDLIQSIRSGKPINHGQRIAESTLTAIGGRIAATTGRTFTWDWLRNACKESLVPDPSMWKPGPGIFHPISTGADELA